MKLKQENPAKRVIGEQFLFLKLFNEYLMNVMNKNYLFITNSILKENIHQIIYMKENVTILIKTL